MDACELEGRKRKILEMAALMAAHLKYLPEEDQREVRKTLTSYIGSKPLRMAASA